MRQEVSRSTRIPYDGDAEADVVLEPCRCRCRCRLLLLPLLDFSSLEFRASAFTATHQVSMQDA
eukprot:1190810-Prorocentrum_minimum.AAC.2